MSNNSFQKFHYVVFLLAMLTPSLINGQCHGTLVWSDEFNGSTLDTDKWGYDLGNGCPSLCGWGNSELEYYTNTTNNVRVSGGQLVIEVKNQAMGGSSFTSGKIKTLGKFSKTYGRFEAKMKLPSGAGLWPAFWMLPVANVYGGWPTSGEIDIMENRGDQISKVDGTLHYGAAWPNNRYDGNDYSLSSGDFSSDWHVFAVEWDANEIRWFVDSIRYKTETKTPNSLNPASNSTTAWPWDQDFYIIFNVAVGGWFTGVTNAANVVLTKPTMEVDYVRVYDISPSSTDQSPYWGVAKTLPAKIEMEEFDKGCGDAAFYDTDLENQGGAFRDEKVDIQVTSDVGGGYNIGWIPTGEWLEYTINVPASGTYDFAVRASSAAGGGTIHVEIDGVNVTGPINIPSTGGWQNWTSISSDNISLSAGIKVMRVFVDAAGANFNYIDITTNTLPLVITQFTTEGINQTDVLVNWQTTGEKNIAGYYVETSLNKNDWEAGPYVKAANLNLNNYSFLKTLEESTLVYIRIKVVDKDGKITYSEIKSFTSGSKEEPLMIIESDNNILISSNDIRTVKIVALTDCLGNKINYIINFNGNNLTITPDLSTGIYILTVVAGDRLHNRKVLLDNYH